MDRPSAPPTGPAPGTDATSAPAPDPAEPTERAVRAVERAGTPDDRSRRRRPWLLVVLTVAVWIGVLVAVLVGYLLTRQPPLTPVPVGG